MEYWNWRRIFVLLLVAFVGVGMIGGCDSGEQVVDEVTGNRALKQYHRTKKDIEKITEQQAERYESIPDDEDKKGEEQEH
jgi:hypothetical protein